MHSAMREGRGGVAQLQRFQQGFVRNPAEWHDRAQVRHRRDIRGLGDKSTGGRGGGTRRSDIADHGQRGAEQALDDMLSGTEQPARGIQFENQSAGAFARCRDQRIVDVVGNRGIYAAVDFDQLDPSVGRGGVGGAGREPGNADRCGNRDQGEGSNPQAHAPPRLGIGRPSSFITS